jgi:predicted nucleic acid-binding protein
MSKVLVDTGPLYALVDPSDGQHRRAVAEAAVLAESSTVILASWSTVLEGYTLVLHRLGSKVALQWLDEVTKGCGLLNPTPAHYEQAMIVLRRFDDQAITMVDAVTAVLSATSGWPVWTYDHHFDVLGIPAWR